MRLFSLAAIGLILMFVVGCMSDPASPSTRMVKLDAEPKADTERAKALNDQAVQLIAKADYNGAEKLLLKAVEADGDFGPAQNNLGVVYYSQSESYSAAQHFLLAAALLPRDPEPRNGLGLVFESSNRFDDAVSYYDRASALGPSNIEYVGNAARARIRRGDRGDDVRAMLTRIIAEDTRAEWNQWARQTLAHLDR